MAAAQVDRQSWQALATAPQLTEAGTIRPAQLGAKFRRSSSQHRLAETRVRIARLVDASENAQLFANGRAQFRAAALRAADRPPELDSGPASARAGWQTWQRARPRSCAFESRP